MRARLLRCALVAGAVALFGCTNDYDQFDFGSAGEGGTPNDGASEADRSVTGGQAGQGGQGPGGQGGSSGADAQGGGAPSDGPGDIVAQEDAPPANDAADATDAIDAPNAPDVADARSEGDASRDVSAEPDGGPPDVSLDVQPDISPDVAQERDAAVDVRDASLDVASDAPPCGPGSKLCGTTCVPTNDPTTGCAAVSCNPCVFPNATATCGDAGACAIGTCNNGFLDCDGVAANGCEVTAATNVDNCGQCGRACSGLNTISRRCQNGVCTPACVLGFDNCTSPAAPAADDGCERAVRSNTSCGSCNNDCTALGPPPLSCLLGPSPPVCGCVPTTSCGGVAGVCNGTNQCVCGGTTCHLGETCLSVVVDAGADGGSADIEAGADGSDDAEGGGGADGDIDGGVEAGGGTIVVDFCACNGATACGFTQTCCPSGCRDLSTDPSNCGACGRACFNGFACVAGVCQCDTNGDCNGGAPGTCTMSTGQCTCSGSVCNRGERCQVGGTCG